MILQGVLALSGVHFETQNRASHLVATYEHLAQALRGLKYGLTRFVSGQNDLALELLVTTLLFCFIECVRGDTDGNAFRHLNAARHLFPSILQDMALTKSEPETISFLLEYYTYILSLSSFSLPSNPDAFLAKDVQLAFEAVSSIEKPMTGMLLGCAHELFTVIPYAMTELDGGDVEASQFCHIDACAIRQKVLSWSPPQKYTQNWIAAGRLYQLAILLLLEDRGRVPEACSSKALSFNIEDNPIPFCDYWMIRSFPEIETGFSEADLDTNKSLRLKWGRHIWSAFLEAQLRRNIIDLVQCQLLYRTPLASSASSLK
ncbi:hypothetical protein FGADI_9156 [Fusarium gaditjirri]|uniref:Uncharacterized protein n=1 Tax=Fusarium gaditjirri TaxID=282569 RepID=A0A8H4WSW7_9HYPO|nr:hypothetical protein FGADI_9156 [Fusarium gaditjirri]